MATFMSHPNWLQSEEELRAVEKSKMTYSFMTLMVVLAGLFGCFSQVSAADRGKMVSGETHTNLQILAPSYMDSWIFYGKAGDTVIINAVKTTGNLNSYLDLYSPTGLKEVSTAPWYDQLSHKLLETGLYTVLVQDYQLNDAGEYNITFLKLPGVVSSPGDLDGGVILSGSTLSGIVNVASDLDAFQFYGEVGDTVIINAVKTTGNLNTYMDLHSPTGLKEASTAPWYDQLSHKLLQTGLYTVLVQDYQLDDTGKYNVSLTKIPADLSPGIYNSHPPNGTDICVLNDSFTWDAVKDALGYDLYFGKNVTEPLLKVGENLQSPSMSFPSMKLGTIYYWHVIAHTSNGDIQGPYLWFQTCNDEI